MCVCSKFKRTHLIKNDWHRHTLSLSLSRTHSEFQFINIIRVKKNIYMYSCGRTCASFNSFDKLPSPEFVKDFHQNANFQPPGTPGPPGPLGTPGPSRSFHVVGIAFDCNLKDDI